MSDANETLINEQSSEAEVPTESEVVSETEALPENEAVQSEPPRRKKSKAPIFVTLLAVTVIAVIAIVLGLGKDKTVDPIFYFENNGFYMKNINAANKEAVKICDADEEASNFSDIRLNSERTEILFSLSESENDEEDIYDTYSTLYRYNLLTPSTAPITLSNQVIDYVYDEGTATLFCLTGENNALVQIDADGNKTEIADNIEYFKISDDGLRLVYTAKDAGTFLKENGKEPVKLCEKGSIEYSDGKLSVLYILQDTDLYKVLSDGTKELIDTDVSSCSFQAADGYYFKTVKNWLLKDLFEDDMAQADNEIKIPSDSDSEAYELYSERLARDQIRNFILDPEMVFSVQDVYYYSGSESKRILQNALDPETYPYLGDELTQTYFFCSVVNTDEIEKILMSDIWESVESVEDDISDAFGDVYDLISEPLAKYSQDYFIYKGNYAAPIGVKGLIFDTLFDENNNALYLTVNEDGDYEGKTKLYKISFTEQGLEEPELISEKASYFDIYLTEDGKLLYLEESSYSDEESFNTAHNVYFDSNLILENISEISECDFETGFILFDRYKMDEDNTPDLDEVAQPVLYSLTSDTVTPLEEDLYYSFFDTPSGNKLLLEEDYYNEESRLYLIENGALTDLKTSVPIIEQYSYANDVRECINYSWDENFDDWFSASLI